ncbi:condensation domain-containing protein [Actinocrispum wychmicini]|uniref:Non-ribosomal peptide synthetase component F n=1 Tax=Actinocrispum wychmicini TaxID=1213861 RepID=A0A4R2J9R9_9PSEU|nr:condensation domain-containing protein [Actinocrispum wychmicini]TCO56103.1 non-ribosomal peptide synthetase component F [Actinocrispum wychmicini]
MASSSYLGATGAGKEHDFTGYYVFPASSAQKRLWFLCQLEPESNAAYNVTSAVRMTGDLDRLHLQHAVDAVIARHEALRTGVALVDGEPQQVVAPSALVALPMIDCSTLDRDARLRVAVRAEAGRPFVLHEPPLVRMVLLRMSADEHVLVVTIHHTVCDGWSIELFFRDLARAYTAGLDGEPPIQYADYVVWQEEHLADGGMDRLLEYWRPQLAGVPSLDLPTDRPRPPVRTVRGAVRTESVPADLVERLTTLGRTNDATLFMVLLSGFKLLLAHLSGQREIAVGTPVAGREHPDADDVIGFFANTLVLSDDIDVEAPFADVLGAVRSTCLDSFAHREMPFDRLVAELRPPRDLSRTPLFQVMFALQTTPGVTLDLPGLRVEPIELTDGSAKFDLWLTGVPSAEGLRLRLEYNTDLFDDATAERLLAQYLDMLSRIAEDPSSSVTRVAAGTPPPEWTYGLIQPLTDLLDIPADGTAIDGLTFPELRDRGNSLARGLRSAGVAPGQVVAVHLPRTPELLVGVCAVLTAGAAVLMLDPDRAETILADADPAILLTTSELAETVSWQRVLLVDAHQAGGEVEDKPSPDDLAAVVYPQGTVDPVRISHRALANLVTGVRDSLGLSGDDVIGAVAEPGSALALVELLLPLATGARTTLTDAESTVVFGTAAKWRALLSAGRTPVSRAVCVGEPFEAELVRSLQDTGAQVWRAHGVAEAGVLAGVERVGQAGPPLANTSRHLLDGRLEPVPVGTVGELYIGGVGEELCRTALRARYTTDGQLEVVGPADDRIELRDHWVDPAVVATALGQQEHVAEAAVVAGEFGDETTLVGWLARGQGRPGTDAELVRQVRVAAARHLPEHLVPSVFGVLDTLPRKENGAVDRRMLRARQAEAVFGSTDQTRPRNRVERIIADLFGELLDVPRPGVHANFFGLGGHSLLAAKVIARVRQEFGVPVQVREFFRRPTAAGLAESVGAAEESRQADDATARALARMSDDEVNSLLARMR